MVKVYIITEGGEGIGFGHITRCLSFYQAFEKRGIIPEFIVSGDVTTEELSGFKRHRTFNWLKEKERLFSLIENVDIAIIDSYLADFDVYKKISQLAKISVYIDDNKRLVYPEGIVINGTIYAKELCYSRRKGTVHLLGSQYIPLRKEFWNMPAKRIKKKISSIMVTFGGYDSKNVTPKVLKALKDNYKDMRKFVVIGKGFKNIANIKRNGDKRTNFIYNPDAQMIKKIILDSDIAISAGGQTLYELARIGVPSIGICMAKNQERNLESWQKKDVIEYIGWYDNANLRKQLRKAIGYLAGADIRKNKSETGRKLVDGKGSLRAVKIILSNMFKRELSLRKATLDDASDIFNLSNDVTVRRNSFNSEKIKWEDHLRWLKEKLNDDNCVFLILNINDVFYGQARFDINPAHKEVIVNIALKKDIRGLGLGPVLLNKSIYALLRLRSDIRLIKAYIKETNIFSIKAFEKANFKFSEDTTVRRNKAKVYIKEGNYVSA